MVALYILSLVISSGLFGVFVRQVLAELGFVAGFEAGVMLAGGVGLLYAAVQLVFLAVLNFVVGRRSVAFYTCEVLSQAAALLLIGYLLRLEVPWPHEALERAEPLVYLAMFGGVHTFLKLATFYASLNGVQGMRWGYATWGAAALVCGFAGYVGMLRWLAETERARPMAPEVQSFERAGEAYALARSIPEGSTVRWEGPEISADSALTLLWAADEERPLDEEKFYVVGRLEGDEVKDYYSSVRLRPSGWVELVIPPESLPENFHRASFSWGRDPRPSWQRLLKVHPIVYRPALGLRDPMAPPPSVFLSGPYEHAWRGNASGMNVLVIGIDGLRPDAVSILGAEEKRTPSLDRFGSVSMVFQEAFSPAPEAEAAYMSLFTGLTPMQHGYMGGARGAMRNTRKTLAEILQQAGYVTAAFTEGEAPHGPDLTFGSGFERGFEIFDPSFPGASNYSEDTTSGVTLEKAQSWIQRHSNRKFFLFVRVRELEHLGNTERYEDFIAGDEASGEGGVYEKAVAFLDSRIGALVKFVRDRDTRKNTVVAIVSPYAQGFASQSQRVTLPDPELRIVMLVHIPGMGRSRRNDVVGLDDLSVTLAGTAGLRYPQSISGKDFSMGSTGKHPVSVQRDPRAYSLRTGQWRYTWEPDENEEALYRVSGASDWWRRDLSGIYPQVTRQFREELTVYLRTLN